MEKVHLINDKGVRRSNVRIRNDLRTFKWEIQTIEFKMNDIYCVTNGWGGQICGFIVLKWEGKSKVKIRVRDCFRQALERKIIRGKN